MKRKIIIAILISLALSAMPCTTVYAAKDTYIKESYVGYCEEIGAAYGISPELLEAIIEHESSGNTYAENYNGTCFGLCQINQRMHQKRMDQLGVVYLSSPKGNITVAADILTELMAKHKDLGLALMKYHGEPDAVRKYKEGKLSKYASGVMKRAAELKDIHDGKD